MIKDFFVLVLCIIGGTLSSFFVLEGVETGEITFRGTAEISNDPVGFWIKISILASFIFVFLGFLIHTAIVILRKFKVKS